MSTDDRTSESVAAQMVDELKLQIWLGRAELDHPSLRDVSDEASVLAGIRDEMRLQARLGRMELAEDWDNIEDRWRHFMHRASTRAHAAGDELRGMLKNIRESYSRSSKD
ncbi:MAG: hypothetical protein ACI8S6_004703 [Myxococcota bacterium]|jgi:hypothetical protein